MEIYKMSKIIVVKNLDGSCLLINPSAEALQTMSVEEVAAKDVPKGLPYRIVDRDKIPKDRTFRNAWTDDLPTDTVDIDLNKARVIHLESLRRLRNEKLKESDVAFMKALESGDIVEQDRLKLVRQALRDLPKTLDLTVATTAEELKVLIPDILK